MTLNVRVNEEIRAKEVRLIALDGAQLGVKSLSEALEISYNQDMDLVEIAPQASPPVCRIMDYGKYKYEQEQKDKKARKHQATVVVKEIKLRPKIENHDFEVKRKHVSKFLEKGARVKVTIMFRGREMAHPSIGRTLLDRLAEEVASLGIPESAPKLDGRNMIMILTPTIHRKEVSHAKNENP
ncbi:MAG: translation initiation factor IF-3 [Actinobacteria bacterium]|nr:translation initiation factor IF-3 [Actinomycetota bacterium]